MSDLKGDVITLSQWGFIILSFLAVLVINMVAVFKPMKMGLKALHENEW
jgi:hypothetical protein